MVAEPLALRVAPTPGALAPSNGTGGSISSDWVAPPPRNNQSLGKCLPRDDVDLKPVPAHGADQVTHGDGVVVERKEALGRNIVPYVPLRAASAWV